MTDVKLLPRTANRFTDLHSSNKYFLVVSIRHTDVERLIMKIATVFAFILLAGCSAAPTMEALETQALLTGDWTAVEKREHAIARRASRATVQCPPGYIAICDVRAGERNNCACADRDAFRMTFSH